MPDGFDPHRELERIMTLRELMTECRKAAPDIMELYRVQLQKLQDEGTEASLGQVLYLGETIFNRAYGKPRQQVHVVTDQGEKAVKIYVPDNGRDAPGARITKDD